VKGGLRESIWFSNLADILKKNTLLSKSAILKMGFLDRLIDKRLLNMEMLLLLKQEEVCCQQYCTLKVFQVHD